MFRSPRFNPLLEGLEFLKDLRTFLRTLLLCVVTSLGWDRGTFGICTFHIIPFIHRTYGCDHIVLDQQHSQQNSCSVQKYVFNDSNFLRWNKYLPFLLSHLFWFMGQHIRISWTCGTGNKRCKFRQNIKLFGLKNCSIDNMRLKCLLHPLPSID